MQEDVKKFLSMFEGEKIADIFKKFDLDIDDFADDFSAFLQHREKIHNEYFSFVDKYINDEDFFKELDLDTDIENLILTKLVVSDEFYYSLMDHYYNNKEILSTAGIVFDSNDLNYYLNKGISLNDIIDKFEILPAVQVEICLEHPEMVYAIMDSVTYPNVSLIAVGIVQNHYQYLEKYFGNYSSFSDKLTSLLKELANYDDFDFDSFFEVLITSYLGNNDISVLEDENLVRKFIDIGGSKALVFATNPSPELVSYTNFSYYDYSLYDGSYRNSSSLLLKFLREGKTDALMYAKKNAVNEDVIDIIKNSDISLDRIKSYGDINDSYLVAKYFAENGDYSLISSLTSILSNIECFEYVLNLHNTGEYVLEPYYDNSDAYNFLCGVLVGEWSFFDSYNNFDISLNVASRLIEIGFNVDVFVRQVSKWKNRDVFIEAFAMKNEYLPLLYTYDEKIVTRYADKIKFELFLDAKAKYGDVILPKVLLFKFVKEGHYEVLDIDNLYISEFELEEFGFDTLTYEEYLKLPDYVQNIPVLKELFLDKDASYLKELLENDPNSSVLEKAILSGMTFDDIKPYMNGFRSLTPATVLHLLKNGDKRGVRYLSFYHDNDVVKEIGDLYYELLNGRLPDTEDLNSSFHFAGIIIRKFIKMGRFEILEVVDKIYGDNVELLLNSGYDFEMFKKYPVLNGEVIKKFVTLENEEDLVKTLEQLKEKKEYLYFSEATELFINMYKVGFSKDSLSKMQNIININCKDLTKYLNEDDYEIFNIVDIREMVNNKIFLSRVLNHISLERTLELLNSFSINSDTKLFIIRKMVTRGYYDFISYYTDKIEEDVLKRALLGGYFPEKQVCENRYFSIYLKKMSFTKEELDYLKSKIQVDYRYIIFFPEIIDDFEVLVQFIKEKPSLIKLLDVEKRKDINLLKIIVKEDPRLCSELIYSSISSKDLVTLLNMNISLLNYLESKYLNIEVIKEIVSSYPNVVDFYSGYLDDNTILTALNTGYKFSDKTSVSIIKVALKNNINVEKSLLINLETKTLLAMANDLINSADSTLSNLFKDVLNELYENDKYDFIYEFVLFIRNNWYLSDEIKIFLDSFEIDTSKYMNYDFSNKESFLLSLRLDELPRDETALSMIDEILENADNKKIIISWIDNYLVDSEAALKKKYEIAKKYFLENPMYYISIADINDADIINMVKEQIYEYPQLYRYVPSILDNKKLILNLLGSSNLDSVSNLYYYLNTEFRNDLEILEVAIKLNEGVFRYVNADDPKIIEFAKNYLFDYPIVFKYVPGLITDKETALKLVSYDYGAVYTFLPEKLKTDFDICSSLLDVNVDFIFKFPNSMDRFKELVCKALSIRGDLINRITNVIDLDEELVIKALCTYPTAFFTVPEQFFNANVFAHVGDLTLVDRSYLTVPKILEIIHYDTFDMNNQKNCEFVVDYFLSNLSHDVVLDKNDQRLRDVFAKGINLDNSNLISPDGATFRKLVMSLPYLDIEMFDVEIRTVLKDALEILSKTGKLNTLEKNPIFNYDVVKYIYPLFGADFVLDIIKYNTPAASLVAKEIKTHNEKLVTDYYDIICKYNIFVADDKRVHYAFRYFEKIKPLVTDIINFRDDLTEADVRNLRKIIIGENVFGINTYDELVAYDEFTESFWQEKMNTDDICEIKNVLATLFGYNNVSLLATDFNNFQLKNFPNLKIVREDIIKQYGKEKAKEIFEECFYTKKDASIIILMSRVIESENINELKELMSKFIRQKDGALDYCDEVREIINKIRKLHNYQFNGRLTRIDDIKSDRLEKDDPNNPYGVTIIEMNSEKFNFLAHRLYSYDSNMSGFAEKLMKEPSLWTKLEGASTLSTSSISDKGFWFLHNTNPNGVIYLFNDLPKNFMLFMNGRDLYVEHGGYKMEPTASKNSFTNIDALNQCSCFKHSDYNEVAGFREGMLPCAFACIGDAPNEDTIRAAKFFSEMLGVDIPIIKFNIKAYDEKKKEDLRKAKEEYMYNPNYEAMRSIFIDGIKTNTPEERIRKKIDYCLNVLNTKYRNGEISFQFFTKSLIEMESVVGQIIVDLPDCKKELSRIGVYRKTLLVLKGCTKEEIITLETAAMGESGIMYKYKEGDNTYLLKPSVDKKKHDSQPFRADIQEAASRLQEFLSPSTAVKVESIGGSMKISKQELVEISSENSKVLEDWVSNGGALDYQYSSALLREYVVDFLLCNFDCFVGNFIIDSSNCVRGIDKEQSFRFIDNPQSLKADYSYTPNGVHRIPIYQILFNRYKNGEIDLDLSVVTDTIEKVKLLSDEDYKNFFRDYATGLDKYRVDEILNMILKRRDDAIFSMEEFIEELREMKKSEGVTL